MMIFYLRLVRGVKGREAKVSPEMHLNIKCSRFTSLLWYSAGRGVLSMTEIFLPGKRKAKTTSNGLMNAEEKRKQVHGLFMGIGGAISVCLNCGY